MILDARADMQDHIKKICKTCHFHLTNISKIRTYLDRESTETIIHAFETTNLDYCNAIQYGLPKVLLNRLQLVQNRAARIVTFTKRYEHITPSLIHLIDGGFFALRVWGAYVWRGLYMEGLIFGILRYLKNLIVSI